MNAKCSDGLGASGGAMANDSRVSTRRTLDVGMCPQSIGKTMRYTSQAADHESLTGWREGLH